MNSNLTSQLAEEVYNEPDLNMQQMLNFNSNI